MPFLNQDIRTTNLTSTSITATTFYSGSTELSQVNIPQNRFLLYSNRTPVTGAGAANVQTVTFTYTIPSGTIVAGNSLEVYVMGSITSSNASGKILTVKFGSANTTSDTTICSYSNTTSTSAGFNFLARMTFVNNSLVTSNNVQSLAGAWGPGTPVSGTSFSLSSQTTYISITTQRPGVGDLIIIRNSDVFINTQ